MLDTASLDVVVEALKLRLPIDGVTMNESLVAKEQVSGEKNYWDHVGKMLGAVPWDMPVSVPLRAQSIPDAFVEASNFHQIIGRRPFYIKVPCDRLDLIHALSTAGVVVNATACFTARQARMAELAGAGVVSFFFCRMVDRISSDTVADSREQALDEISTFAGFDGGASIICGSIRSVDDVVDCWLAGADYVTAPIDVIQKMSTHVGTDESIKKFQEAAKAWL